MFAQILRRSFGFDRYNFRQVDRNLVGKRVDITTGTQGDHSKSLTSQRVNDSQSIAADRTGRAEYRNTFAIHI